MDNNRCMHALDEMGAEWNTIRKRREPKGKGKGFATVQPSTRELLGKRDPHKKKSHRKGKPANMFRILEGWLSER